MKRTLLYSAAILFAGCTQQPPAPPPQPAPAPVPQTNWGEMFRRQDTPPPSPQIQFTPPAPAPDYMQQYNAERQARAAERAADAAERQARQAEQDAWDRQFNRR